MEALPTPDRAHGLFETLLVVGGEPVELDAHLARLSGSLESLFGAVPPAGLAETARERVRNLPLGRLRIGVRHDGSRTRATLATEDVAPANVFPGPERAAALRSVRCDGGLGPHKWADRRPLREAAGESLPLLLDRGREALEAGRANVFAVFGETLATPPADSRILPGIARAGAIEAARDAGVAVVERPLLREELATADELFLTGSVRGVEPARALDGEPLPGMGEVSRRVAAGLRQRWLGGSPAAAGQAPAGAPPPGLPAR
jgi:para-aminobenzoate synthetase / 4-amino-4-deoxychorismate lyase